MKDQAFGVIPVWQQGQSDQFLLIQHRAGHWGFPKGHAEPGESATITACREFEEETSIRDYRLLEVAFVERYSFIKRNKKVEKTVTYFPALVTSTQVICQPEEIRDFTWVTYEAALLQLSFEPSRRVLVQAYQYLLGQGALRQPKAT